MREAIFAEDSLTERSMGCDLIRFKGQLAWSRTEHGRTIGFVDTCGKIWSCKRVAACLMDTLLGTTFPLFHDIALQPRGCAF